MPNPLPRDLCKRLGKAYPEEVGAHRFEEGDEWYNTTLGVYSDVPLLVYEISDDSRWHADAASVWVLHLSDLLELAEAHSNCLHLCQHRIDSDGEPQDWTVEDCSDPDHLIVGADTLEVALALWLLAGKENTSGS